MRRIGLTLTVVIVLTGCTTASSPTASPAVSASPPASSTPAATPSATPSPPPTASPSPAPTASPTPEPVARTVTSDDGLLTIDVPAGALPDDVELTATAQGAEDLPPELAGLQLRSAFYRLEPDGLTFAEPVTITRRGALADLGFELDEGVIPIILLALRTSDGGWSWLDDQEIELDGEDLVVSGKATHTSTLMGFGGTNFARRQISDPDATITLDETFIVEGGLEYAPGVDPAAFWDEVDPYIDGTSVLTGTRQSSGNTFSQAFTCAAPGTSWVGVSAQIEQLATHPFFAELGLPPTQTELYVGIDLTCILPSSSPSPAGITDFKACLRVVHRGIDDFISYLFGVVLLAYDGSVPLDRLVLTVEGANNGQPQQLRYDAASGTFSGELGLHEPGRKKIVRLALHLGDGTTIVLTDTLIEALGGEVINVRYPQEDVFGTCPQP